MFAERDLCHPSSMMVLLFWNGHRGSTYIIGTGVSEDIVERLRFTDVFRCLSDNDNELDLVVGKVLFRGLRNARDDHSSERPNQRRDGLVEQDGERGLGHLCLGLREFHGLRIKRFGLGATRDTHCVVGVVEPQAAHDLDLVVRERREELGDREYGVGNLRGGVERGPDDLESLDGRALRGGEADYVVRQLSAGWEICAC